MSKLRIAPGFDLPVETVTQAIGIVAKRRVGKSYTARRIAEQLLNARQQLVIVDPKGDWWGIRSSADGKAPGFPVVILGGEHKDVPLEVGSGEVVAKLVVEERVSVLLDLSDFRKRELAVFMADFLETLYRLKAKEALRTPVMVIIDEADAVAPQKPNPGEERMLGAAEDIVRRGGQRGIGCMMITQRTAVLNKNVLTQCEMLVALRTISPQDLKAMQAWIDVHGSDEERETLMQSLPSLPTGDAWFWSPGWPTADGIFRRVHVAPIETFDSGATPKAGEKRVEPKSVADVDLEALTRQMAATIERAKADDPKELRKEMLQLKKELAIAKRDVVATPDRSAIDRAVRDAIKPFATRFSHIEKAVGNVTRAARPLLEAINGLEAINLAVEIPHTNGNGHTAPTRPRLEARHLTRETKPARLAPSSAPPSDLSKGQQKIINGLAELEAIGVETPSRAQLGMFAGYNLTGGTGAQHIADLNAAGLVDLPEKGVVQLTDAGRAIAAPADPPASLRELHTRMLAKLPDGQRRILEHLISIYPDGISRADLGQAVDYNLTGGSGAQHVADLVTIGAAVIPRVGQVAASAILFPEALV